MQIVSNHYKMLGVPRYSTQEEVKVAYMILAGQFHPDRNPSGEKRMAEINVAYTVLRDVKRRAEYDKQLTVLCKKCEECHGFGGKKKQRGFARVEYNPCKFCDGVGVI